ncbi:cell division protein CrgA [Galbitalea sp. SE-J8]|uniref:cell division protein CrgA n=1 Tax=Galbitalea sp. SE-J8 TaxID=3054952 RepID=UPI00259CE90C|nr:cell division protein CrgA [Galbitalea sp. SE-J8]MDM4763276.1 cell division protein CrgA [Galbitalea sp. SE-J8]
MSSWLGPPVAAGTPIVREGRPPPRPASRPRPARMLAMARNTEKSVAPPESRESSPNPVWFKPIMFGFMIVGLAWIIVYYVSSQTLPIPSLSNWNIAIGFGIMFIGFLMTTRWR